MNRSGKPHRFGDRRSDGGWACRCRQKLDRTVRGRQSRAYDQRRRSKWMWAGMTWYAKLQDELLRQAPHQKGWEAP